jgi:hypothetical protein
MRAEEKTASKYISHRAGHKRRSPMFVLELGYIYRRFSVQRTTELLFAASGIEQNPVLRNAIQKANEKVGSFDRRFRSSRPNRCIQLGVEIDVGDCREQGGGPRGRAGRDPKG